MSLNKAEVEAKVAALLEELKPDAFILALTFNNPDEPENPHRYFKGKGEDKEMEHLRDEVVETIESYRQEKANTSS